MKSLKTFFNFKFFIYFFHIQQYLKIHQLNIVKKTKNMVTNNTKYFPKDENQRLVEYRKKC